MNKAIFLDRDGVINAAIVRNGKPYPPDSLEELVILPGVREGLDKLKKAGFKFDQWLDLAFYQLELSGPKAPTEG